MTIERLQAENEELRRRLEEAEDALRHRFAEYETLLNQAPLGPSRPEGSGAGERDGESRRRA